MDTEYFDKYSIKSVLKILDKFIDDYKNKNTAEYMETNNIIGLFYNNNNKRDERKNIDAIKKIKKYLEQERR